MKTIRPWMIIASLIALMLVSGLAGALIGVRMTRQKITQQNNPETWNEAAASARRRSAMAATACWWTAIPRRWR